MNLDSARCKSLGPGSSNLEYNRTKYQKNLSLNFKTDEFPDVTRTGELDTGYWANTNS